MSGNTTKGVIRPATRLRSRNKATIKEGMSGGQGVHQEHVEENAGEDHLGGDLRRVEPAETVAAVESELRQADGEREHHEPFQIEHAILGLRATRERGSQAEPCQRTDRHIDVEHPAPIERLGEPATERRSDHRPDHYTDAPDGKCGAVLLPREHAQQ